MFSGLYFFIIGFIVGIGFIYLMVRVKRIKVDRLDERVLLLKLPFLGMVEAEESGEYRGFFVKSVLEKLEKMKFFHKLMDVDTMLYYANDYNINYIGIEGDMKGTWNNGRLAYSTLSKGYSGGYNVYLNPDLDCESVCRRLNEELVVKIEPRELYTFLFLHEIGHTKKAGNECYLTAMINHSLSGGRRSVRRRRALNALHARAEKFADNFAIQELLKLRRKGLHHDTGYECCSAHQA